MIVLQGLGSPPQLVEIASVVLATQRMQMVNANYVLSFSQDVCPAPAVCALNVSPTISLMVILAYLAFRDV